jgi:hypothetical protein
MAQLGTHLAMLRCTIESLFTSPCPSSRTACSLRALWLKSRLVMVGLNATIEAIDLAEAAPSSKFARLMVPLPQPRLNRSTNLMAWSGTYLISLSAHLLAYNSKIMFMGILWIVFVFSTTMAILSGDSS